MPRLCEPCRFHSADDSLSACPVCGGVVKFTLLGPPGSDPDLMAAQQARESGRSQLTGLGHFFRGKMLVVTAVAVVGLVAAIFGVWYLRGDSFDDRTAKLKPGMKMTDAMRIMGDANKPKAKRPSINITVGGEGEDPNRIPDFDRPVETTGTGYVEYASGTSGVRIHYTDHVVTKVEPYTPTGGLRKRVTVSQ
jgi:hypothetical protein